MTLFSPKSGKFPVTSLFLVTGMLLGVTLIAFMSTGRRARAAGPAAYTVFRTEQAFDAKGTLKFTSYYVNALRSDGTRMSRATNFEQQTRQLYYTNGSSVRTSELTGRKSTFATYAGAPAKRDPALSCLAPGETQNGWSMAGEDTIGGYRAVRVVLSTKDEVITMWYALDAECANLQSSFRFGNGTATKQNFAGLLRGEPDLALFQVSPVLREGRPSMLPCPIGQDTCAVLSPAAAEHADRNYTSANTSLH